jgi:hypothetical protein
VTGVGDSAELIGRRHDGHEDGFSHKVQRAFETLCERKSFVFFVANSSSWLSWLQLDVMSR